MLNFNVTYNTSLKLEKFFLVPVNEVKITYLLSLQKPDVYILFLVAK